LPPFHKELDIELHGAFARSKFSRLAYFARWRPSAIAAPEMPDSWRRALNPAGEKPPLCPAEFSRQAKAIRAALHLVANFIGL
jgi:hypothetical protein